MRGVDGERGRDGGICGVDGGRGQGISAEEIYSLRPVSPFLLVTRVTKNPLAVQIDKLSCHSQIIFDPAGLDRFILNF